MLNEVKMIRYLGMVNTKEIDQIPESAWEDRDFVKLAAFRWGEAYKYISENLKNDRELFISTFDEAFNVLQKKYPSELSLGGYEEKWEKTGDLFFDGLIDYALKANPQIMITRKHEHAKKFKYANEKFKDDKELVLEVIKWEDEILDYISDRLKNDEDVALEVIEAQKAQFQEHSSLITYKKLGKDLLSNREIMARLILKDPRIFAAASLELRDDLDFVLNVYKSCDPKDGFEIFSNIGRNLLKDRNKIVKIIDIDPYTIFDVIEYVGKDNYLILYAINSAKKLGNDLLVEDLIDELANEKELETIIEKNKSQFQGINKEFLKQLVINNKKNDGNGGR